VPVDVASIDPQAVTDRLVEHGAGVG